MKTYILCLISAAINLIAYETGYHKNPDLAIPMAIVCVLFSVLGIILERKK